jgi:hypothetical protein
MFAVLRMGWISHFLSKAVITGFLFGAAIDVTVGELPKLTGTEADGVNTWQELWSWLGTVREADGATLLVGIVSLAVIFGLRFADARVPGALVLVIGDLVASAALDFAGRGIALVGDVPCGFAPLVLPTPAFIVDNVAVVACWASTPACTSPAPRRSKTACATSRPTPPQDRHHRPRPRGSQLHRLPRCHHAGRDYRARRRPGAEIRLARVKRDVRALLQRDGVIDTLGHDKIYGNVYEAAADHITRRTQP